MSGGWRGGDEVTALVVVVVVVAAGVVVGLVAVALAMAVIDVVDSIAAAAVGITFITVVATMTWTPLSSAVVIDEMTPFVTAVGTEAVVSWHVAESAVKKRWDGVSHTISVSIH